jgi:L-ascorbate metabolism protein UlaG (beta-lactamase superfamily)
MEIQWLGHACFRITHDGWAIVIDPYNSDYVTGYPKLSGVRADQLLISHDSYGHNYREGVVLSGRPESESPFTVTPMEVWHDTVCGIMRGSCLMHLIECGGVRVAHMGDIGAPLTGEQQSRLFELDAMMITAGSCTALPSQEVWRLTEELMPRVIIPMHYRDGKRGPRRLEHAEELTKHFPPSMVRKYDTDTIEITRDTEPQIALLKFLGHQPEPDAAQPVRRPSLLARVLPSRRRRG